MEKDNKKDSKKDSNREGGASRKSRKSFMGDLSSPTASIKGKGGGGGGGSGRVDSPPGPETISLIASLTNAGPATSTSSTELPPLHVTQHAPLDKFRLHGAAPAHDDSAGVGVVTPRPLNDNDDRAEPNAAAG